MARKAEYTKEQMRRLVLSAAESMMSKGGVDGFSVRALAKKIGFAPGSLYLHFKDVDDIVNHLNAATLKRLAKALEAVKNGAGPEDTLHRYAQAYVAFVEKNRNLWDAMFKYRRSDSGAVPGWYRAVIEELVVPVKRCFEEIAPPKTPGASAQAAKMTWASLHGICSLDVARLRMIMAGDLPSTAAHLVDLHIAGYAAQMQRSGSPKRIKA
jgi:AcrR family transcriptional regulator